MFGDEHATMDYARYCSWVFPVNTEYYLDVVVKC